MRMWGFRILVSNPSPISALGVKSPHLQFLRADQLYIYIYTCVYISLSLYIYIYIYTHTFVVILNYGK